MTSFAMGHQILVESVGIDLGNAFTGHVRQCFDQLLQRYNRRLISCQTTFTRAGGYYACSIVYKAGRGRSNIVRSESVDIRNAFNRSLKKLRVQLQKIKDERNAHHPRARPDKPIQNDGEHRVSNRHVQSRGSAFDLTTRDGAEAYVEARLSEVAGHSVRVRARDDVPLRQAAE